MIGNIYGIDFGSRNIWLYDHNQDILNEMKNAVAIKGKKHVLAIGQSAYEMYEREPAGIEVIFPMKEGVISNYYDMRHILKEALKDTKNRFFGSKYIIAVPTDVTEVEKKAFYDLLNDTIASSKGITVVERCIADAVGLGIDVANETGAFIINFGAETTEMSIIATGGMIMNKLYKKGGCHIEYNIQSFFKQSQDFLIGMGCALNLRTEFGISESSDVWAKKVTGKNLLVGVPEQRVIAREDVENIALEFFDEIISNVKNLLDRTPPLILKNIQSNGIYICGGMANTLGLKKYLGEKLGLAVHTIDEPEKVTIRGIAKIIESKDLSEMSYSMTNENNRWNR